MNGSISNSIEIQDNVLIIKGPITYELAGTYVCDATNSIGTRSASIEINIAGIVLIGHLGSWLQLDESLIN